MGAYHKTLGVPEGATEAEIKKAYRKLASELHPDKHADKSEAEIETFKERFQTVQAAYDGLMDGQSGPKVRVGDMNIDAEVEEMMRRWGASNWGQQRGFSHTYPGNNGKTTQTVEIPIETMFKGGAVNFTTMMPGQTGQGYLQFTKKTWTIKLDPDTPVGHEVTVKEGKNETKFIVMPANSPTYMVQGIDIFVAREIDLFDALIGGVIEVKHPSGVSLKTRVPAGVTNESVIRLNGKGLLNKKGLRGNLCMIAEVKIPELNDYEVKILKEAIQKIRRNKKKEGR